MIQFTKIDAPYLHGYEATRAPRRAEVLRCYASEWAVFRYVDGVMQRDPEPTRFTTMQSARAHARRWLAAA